jgi:hypothetical protein
MEVKMNIELEQVKQTDSRAREYITNHYTHPRRFIGKNVTHLIKVDNSVCGVIVGGSTSFSLVGRKEFFGENCDIQSIINNRLFRLENNTKNLATQVLKVWRKQVVKDWKSKYGDTPIGFETLVRPPLTGACYKADNWKLVGMTKGYTARTNWYRKTRQWIKTDKRLVFMKNC